MSKPAGWIRLFLWYHCTTIEPKDPPNDSVRREWTDDMFANELIMPGEEPGTWTTTEKGIFYAEMLCSTPLPVRVVVDPREHNRVRDN